MKLVEYTSGSAATIYFMDCGQQKYDVEAFLTELATSRPSDYNQLTAQLDRAARYGVVYNGHKAKPLRGESAKPLWEFCAEKCSRIFWFYDEDHHSIIVCTHGFIAKKNHDHRTDIERAQQRRDLYYRLRKKSQIGNSDCEERKP